MTHEDDSEKLPSLTVALDLVRERIASQQAQIAALDAKANVVLTSASVLVGTALAAQLAITTKTISIFGQPLARGVPLALLVGVYIAVVAMAYLAYRVSDYDQAPEPQKLLDGYLQEPTVVTQEDAVRAMAQAFGQNVRRIQAKVHWTRWALRMLVVESVVLGIILIIEAW